MNRAVAEPSAGPDVECTKTTHAARSGSRSGGIQRRRPNEWPRSACSNHHPHRRARSRAARACGRPCDGHCSSGLRYKGHPRAQRQHVEPLRTALGPRPFLRLDGCPEYVDVAGAEWFVRRERIEDVYEIGVSLIMEPSDDVCAERRWRFMDPHQVSTNSRCKLLNVHVRQRSAARANVA